MLRWYFPGGGHHQIHGEYASSIAPMSLDAFEADSPADDKGRRGVRSRQQAVVFVPPAGSRFRSPICPMMFRWRCSNTLTPQLMVAA
jgi:hypothetical protein